MQPEWLVFVSPRFLFPVDSGGKIRTTQILRGLKDGRFRVLLLSPADAGLAERHAEDLRTVCDEFLWWPSPGNGVARVLSRAIGALHPLPIPVRSDWSRPAARLVALTLRERTPAVAVFDFLHSVVLAPTDIPCPSVLFTHNVETEIFDRHRANARNWLLRLLWTDQARKMRRFEIAALRRFDMVVAVSERDAGVFATHSPLRGSAVLPTGVDLDYFRFAPPTKDRHVVFCGSMDWLANQDAMGWFLDEIWQLVVAEEPNATMTVIGRSPPGKLTRRAAARGFNWTFTGFVDDVRTHMSGATAAVIPMRIAGGTRLKVYESMAAGVPVVSTAIGVEGLPVVDTKHFLRAEDPESFARCLVQLMRDAEWRHNLARNARQLVDERFSFRVAARVFEQACAQAIAGRRSR